MPLVFADVAVPALMDAHVQRAEHTADDFSHRAVGRTAMYPKPTPYDDYVNDHRVAHELGFLDWVHVSEHEPQSQKDDQSPAEHEGRTVRLRTRERRARLARAVFRALLQRFWLMRNASRGSRRLSAL